MLANILFKNKLFVQNCIC